MERRKDGEYRSRRMVQRGHSSIHSFTHSTTYEFKGCRTVDSVFFMYLFDISLSHVCLLWLSFLLVYLGCLFCLSVFPTSLFCLSIFPASSSHPFPFPFSRPGRNLKVTKVLCHTSLTGWSMIYLHLGIASEFWL